MRCLQSFNQRCRRIRDQRQLSPAELAALCGTTEDTVLTWEMHSPLERAYPTLDQLVQLSLQTSTPLTQLLDLDEVENDAMQLMLPGLEATDDRGVNGAVEELESLLEGMLLSQQEQELIRRFRLSDAEQQRLILQLLQD